MKVKYMLLALLIAMTGILGGCGKTQPKDPAEQALLSYKEILKAAPAIEGTHDELQDASFDDVQNREMFGEHYDQFAIVDLNQDGIPELIASTVINFRWVPISVFTFADGEAVLLKNPTGEAVNGTFEQMSVANGAYDTYLCAENHIHSVWRGMTPIGPMEENYAYALEGTALVAVDCDATEGGYFYDIAKINTAENAEAIISG